MTEHLQGALISAFVDQELSQYESQRIADHIAACAPCRDAVGRVQSVKLTLSSAPRRALPMDLISTLERHYARRTLAQRIVAWFNLPSIRIPAEVAATAAAVFALWFSIKGFGPEEAIPLEPLLAAHSRYAAEGLVPPGDLVAANFSDQLSLYHAQ